MNETFVTEGQKTKRYVASFRRVLNLGSTQAIVWFEGGKPYTIEPGPKDDNGYPTPQLEEEPTHWSEIAAQVLHLSTMAEGMYDTPFEGRFIQSHSRFTVWRGDGHRFVVFAKRGHESVKSFNRAVRRTMRKLTEGTVETQILARRKKRSSIKEWPLQEVLYVERDGNKHRDALVCGHEVVWFGVSAWKEGRNEVIDPDMHRRRCKQCYELAEYGVG